MRNIFYIFILGLWSLQGFAQQDTVGQMPVLEVSELSNVAPQESYITKYLRFFDRRFDVAEIVEDDEEIVPMLGSEDSIYQERLQNINSLMQLPYNTKVRNYIDVYLSKKRNQTKVMLALSRYYFPVFERELAKHNLPDELKYLAIIESALNPRAYSRAGAGGLWQFMYRTGKMYGLKVDKELDERFDAEKATVAATLYLKYLYGLYNDWTLAIAAYNCGPGNVNKAIRRARNKRDYWEIYNFLPRETRNYVPAFIGATYAMTYYREHGIAIAETEFPEVTDTLMITKELYFSRISEFTGVPLQTIRDYNPQYKLDFIPERQEAFTLKLPCDYILKFIEFADSIYANPPSKEEAIISELMAEQKLTQAPSKVTYRVKRGENLSLIAVRFGVKVDQLMEWNDLKSTLLQVNQILTVYTIKRNMRDMSEVVAYQNAEKAKEA
ncbi:MAG: transglycosylase SLT domain-containing protein, partial [Bacteroidales bacterium]|nr:transglycosylase SLT domain-containing protein [Bacteroidales bacterium]